MWVYGLTSWHWLNICIRQMYMHHKCWRTVKGEACERFEIVFKSLWKRKHFCIHQNNPPPHTETSTLLELDVLGFGRVDHLPYSPDLASFHFDVCFKVKSQLKGRRFSSLPELRSASVNIISQYNQDWYRAIFNKWVKRHRKCIAYNGEYFYYQLVFYRGTINIPLQINN